MQFLQETDCYSVSLDPHHHVALLHWKKPTSFKEYQSGFGTFIELLRQTGVRRSLIDSTLRGALSPEADEWIFNTLQHVVLREDVSEHQLALVMTEDRYQRMVQNYSLLQSGRLELPLQLHYFTSKEEALHWLVNEPLSPS